MEIEEYAKAAMSSVIQRYESVNIDNIDVINDIAHRSFLLGEAMKWEEERRKKISEDEYLNTLATLGKQ
ncbi:MULTISPECIES: hypothetical protein [Yersinia]|uniref:Uncharacterized protein n=1 Tax=Yersinia massiliensis TaxID=419257 RepID=A0ABM6URK3_9GAMM|nr:MULTISPECIES: hypothetical protein [Yersinia]ATM86720.1 hypothetical protein CRN74_11885 [Yersinia frederiksenii]AVX37791.1 hypothetical protein DA391_09030 [Yersinia massiliensis]